MVQVINPGEDLIKSQGNTNGLIVPSQYYVNRGAYNGVIVELSYTPVRIPPVPSLTASASGGSLATGTYYFRVSAIDPLGHETLACLEASVSVVSGGSTGSVVVTIPGAGSAGASSYRVYFSSGPPGTEAAFLTIGAGSLTVTYTGQAGTGGTPLVTSTALPTLDLVMVDAATENGPFTATIDATASVSSITSAGTLKYPVAGVHQFVSCTVNIHSGFWSVKVTPTYFPYPVPQAAAGGGSNVNIAQVGGTPVTSPLSVTLAAGSNAIGSVTANIGTTNGLALDATLATVAKDATVTGVSKDATLAKLNIAQGAAIAGETGPMVQAEALSTVPAYATGTLNPLTQSLSGQLSTVASGRRTAEAVYRNSVAVPLTAADIIATPSAPTTSAITEAGSNLANVAHSVAYAWEIAGMGPTAGSVLATITPAANQAVRLTGVAPPAGVTHVNFFIVNAATGPLWVGRSTAAQFATGDQIISAVGVVSARGGSIVANTMDLGIIGTGVAYNAVPFLQDNAYTPTALATIACAGYSLLYCKIALTATDLRSAPTLNLVPFFQNQNVSSQWHAGSIVSVPLLTGSGAPLQQEIVIGVSGETAVAVAIDAIAGQGAAVSFWTSLA